VLGALCGAFPPARACLAAAAAMDAGASFGSAPRSGAAAAIAAVTDEYDEEEGGPDGAKPTTLRVPFRFS
jgi:hypothetical protein